VVCICCANTSFCYGYDDYCDDHGVSCLGLFSTYTLWLLHEGAVLTGDGI